MNDIKLSIIIPVFNTEKYFTRCIDSVIEAIEKIICFSQIVVVNDGSKGNIDDIITKYINEYPNNITYVKQVNKGRGGARNTGLKNSKGKYISFIDSDDYIDKNMFNDMLSVAENKEADIVICDWETIKKNGEAFRVEAKNLKINDNKIGCFDIPIMPSCCNKIIKRELFDNVSFPEQVNYEDLATIPIIYIMAKNIEYLPNMYYKYYISDTSVMNSNFNINNLALIDMLKISFERINNLKISDDEKDKYKYMLFTRRFYEDLLENICKINADNIDLFLVQFCDKMYNILNEMKDNKYFIKNLKNSSLIKKINNEILITNILKKHSRKLKFLMNSKLYYKFISIIYSGI